MVGAAAMEPVAVGSVAEESLAGTFFFLPAGAALGAEAPDAAALVEDPALRVCAIVADNNVWWTDDVTAEQEQNVEYHATYQLFCLHLQPNNGCSSSALSKSNLLLFAVTFCCSLSPSASSMASSSSVPQFFTCPQCLCSDFRSQAGLTKHQNALHRECSPDRDATSDEAMFTYHYHPYLNGQSIPVKAAVS